jgi:hypothetical protein
MMQLAVNPSHACDTTSCIACCPSLTVYYDILCHEGINRLIIDVDDWVTEGMKDGSYSDVGELTAINSGMSHKYATLRVSGTLKLQKGQTLGMVVEIGNIPDATAEISNGQTSWGVTQVTVPSGADQGMLLATLQTGVRGLRNECCVGLHV